MYLVFMLFMLRCAMMMFLESFCAVESIRQGSSTYKWFLVVVAVGPGGRQ